MQQFFQQQQTLKKICVFSSNYSKYVGVLFRCFLFGVVKIDVRHRSFYFAKNNFEIAPGNCTILYEREQFEKRNNTEANRRSIFLITPLHVKVVTFPLGAIVKRM